MKKIVITVSDKENTDQVNINLDMKEVKNASESEKVAASNVYMKIEALLKELEKIN